MEKVFIDSPVGPMIHCFIDLDQASEIYSILKKHVRGFQPASSGQWRGSASIRFEDGKYRRPSITNQDDREQLKKDFAAVFKSGGIQAICGTKEFTGTALFTALVVDGKLADAGLLFRTNRSEDPSIGDIMKRRAALFDPAVAKHIPT